LQKEINKRGFEGVSKKITDDFAIEKTEKSVDSKISSRFEGNERMVVQTIKERNLTKSRSHNPKEKLKSIQKRIFHQFVPTAIE
jgi:hypothetical protein